MTNTANLSGKTANNFTRGYVKGLGFGWKACHSNNPGAFTSWAGSRHPVKRIFIPSTITAVDENAFRGRNKELRQIIIEADESSDEYREVLNSLRSCNTLNEDVRVISLAQYQEKGNFRSRVLFFTPILFLLMAAPILATFLPWFSAIFLAVVIMIEIILVPLVWELDLESILLLNTAGTTLGGLREANSNSQDVLAMEPNPASVFERPKPGAPSAPQDGVLPDDAQTSASDNAWAKRSPSPSFWGQLNPSAPPLWLLPETTPSSQPPGGPAING